MKTLLRQYDITTTATTFLILAIILNTSRILADNPLPAPFHPFPQISIGNPLGVDKTAHLCFMVDLSLHPVPSLTESQIEFNWDPNPDYFTIETLGIESGLSKLFMRPLPFDTKRVFFDQFQWQISPTNRLTATISFDLAHFDSVAMHVELPFSFKPTPAVAALSRGMLLGHATIQFSSPWRPDPQTGDPIPPTYIARVPIFFDNDDIAYGPSAILENGLEPVRLLQSHQMISPFEPLLSPTLLPLVPTFDAVNLVNLFRWAVHLPWNQLVGGWNTETTPNNYGRGRPTTVELNTIGAIWLVNNSTKSLDTGVVNPTCFVNGVSVGAVLATRKHYIRPQAQDQDLYTQELYIKLTLDSEAWDQILGPTTTTPSSSSSSPTTSTPLSSLLSPTLRVSRFTFSCDESVPVYIPNIYGYQSEHGNPPDKWFDLQRSFSIRVYTNDKENNNTGQIPGTHVPYSQSFQNSVVWTTTFDSTNIARSMIDFATASVQRTPSNLLSYHLLGNSTPPTTIPTPAFPTSTPQFLSTPSTITIAQDPWLSVNGTTQVPLVAQISLLVDFSQFPIELNTQSIGDFELLFDPNLSRALKPPALHDFEFRPFERTEDDTSRKEITIFWTSLSATRECYYTETEWSTEKRNRYLRTLSFPVPPISKWVRDPVSIKYLPEEPHTTFKLSFDLPIQGPNPLNTLHYLTTTGIFFLKYIPTATQLDGSSSGPFRLDLDLPFERWFRDAHNTFATDLTRAHKPNYLTGNSTLDLIYQESQWDVYPNGALAPSFTFTFNPPPTSSTTTATTSIIVTPTQIIDRVTLHLGGIYQFDLGTKVDVNGVDLNNINKNNDNNNGNDNSMNSNNHHNNKLDKKHVENGIKLACFNYKNRSVPCTATGIKLQPNAIAFSITLPTKPTKDMDQKYIPTRVVVELEGIGYQRINSIIGLPVSNRSPNPPPNTISLVATILTTDISIQPGAVTTAAINLGMSFTYDVGESLKRTALGRVIVPPKPGKSILIIVLFSLLVLCLIPLGYYGYCTCVKMRQTQREEQDVMLDEVRGQFESTIRGLNKALDQARPPQYDQVSEALLPDYDPDLEGTATRTTTTITSTTILLDDRGLGSNSTSINSDGVGDNPTKTSTAAAMKISTALGDYNPPQLPDYDPSWASRGSEAV